ncbi:sulfite exporter TauE/SafE family protein [Polaribacter sp.]|nr:sulfite exporter TauE/SafE family protein [Polaribacter sp.]
MDLQIIFESILANWHLIALFLTAAVLYSSVGFGGGSSYLAILALAGFAFSQIRVTALLCNIVVVSGNVILFYQQKKLPWKKLFPLVLWSIPLAYFGGKLAIDKTLFFILLGFTLLFAALSMWISKRLASATEEKKTLNNIKNATLGGGIGFLSGMVGIGGGIFLAPLLHLTNWDTPKKIAATASFFILVNSIAGVFGQFNNPEFHIDWTFTTILLVTVFIGGQIGTRVSNTLLTPMLLKKATAILIGFVSIRILYKHLAPFFF